MSLTEGLSLDIARPATTFVPNQQRVRRDSRVPERVDTPANTPRVVTSLGVNAPLAASVLTSEDEKDRTALAS